MELSLVSLSKQFGQKSVLKNLSFTATGGKAMGLLGRNGAGKTTTIRIIMNIFPPDEGDVLLDGKPLRHSGVRIGYMPEEKGFYPKIKIKDQLLYIAELRGVSRQQSKKVIQDWLERLDLSEYWDKKLETLSKGNQQKIQLAVALIADPDIVILDEPFSGLDPVNAQLLKEIVTEQVNAGKIVLFSSHQMNYVETFCDDVALLHEGQIKLNGSIREIKRRYPRHRISLSLAGDNRLEARSGENVRDYMERLMHQPNDLSRLIDRLDVVRGQCHLILAHESNREAVLEQLVAVHAPVEQFSVVEPTLEDIFVEQTGEIQPSGQSV
ncbi:MAG: ATP-binding cassette domain-containing protein [Clostridiaceae bacterium]|nr:ATP-binding cassette domain-containing protein [Clostridiaceae bacterium]